MKDSPAATVLFMTDTHVGAGSTGFQQQPRCPQLLGPLFESLKKLVRDRHVGYLLHGGDLTELGTAEQIEQSVGLLRSLNVPAAMCLGNHDLTTPASYGLWTEALATAGIAVADCVVAVANWDIILVNTRWSIERQPGYLWTRAVPCVEAITDSQLAWLENVLQQNANRPAIVMTHVPLDPLPPRLTGLEKPIHGAHADYVQKLESTLNRHSRVKLVLAGHNHVNCATRQNGRIHLSTAATLEPTFEARLIHLRPQAVRIETVPLLPMTQDIQWLPEQAWISGQTCDRTIELAFSGTQPSESIPSTI